MTSAALTKKAIQAIDRQGILLVYPMDNRKEPGSIWQALHPRTKMRWEWDDEGDNRVADLWRLREELSRSRKVVYSKWFRNRATFFSRTVFVQLLAYLESVAFAQALNRGPSSEILETLRMDSPISTKKLKEAIGLQGKLLESNYNRAMRPLWDHLLLVGFGEFEDSSFPSLGIGATEAVFEELYAEAQEMDSLTAEQALSERFGEHHLFWRQAQKIRLKTQTSSPR